MKELLKATGWIAFIVAIVMFVGWYQLTVWKSAEPQTALCIA